jgi:hypothetical protein
MKAEGWYRDPYGLHDDRWFSDGRPSRLVRDGGVESYDDPPSENPPAELVRVAEAPAYSGDTKRADAAERPPQEYEIEGAARDDESDEAFSVVDTIIDQGPIDLHVQKTWDRSEKPHVPNGRRRRRQSLVNLAQGVLTRIR